MAATDGGAEVSQDQQTTNDQQAAADRAAADGLARMGGGTAATDDGTAAVRLLKGPSDPQLDQLLGEHKLW